MNKIRINKVTQVDDSYDIIIGKKLIPKIVEGITKIKFSRIAIITDINIKKLYGQSLLDELKKHNQNAILISFHPGEKHKVSSTKEKIDNLLLQNNFDKNSLIIALGGGVVGDISGFIASTFMRGISYIQVPTTLLSMVDSSIGGKTGYNTPFGKNLIGSFYHPKRIFIDLDILNTLPHKEMLNGIAEMVKHAIIADEKYFEFLEKHIHELLVLSFVDERTFVKSISWSCEIKKRLIEKQDKDCRKCLGFGHTISHAIELASDYRIKHGNAVAIGMLAELNVSKNLGIIKNSTYDRIKKLIREVGFSLSISHLKITDIIKNTRYDKKLRGNLHFCLVKKIGKMLPDMLVSESVVASSLAGIE